MDVMPYLAGLQDQSFSAPIFCVVTIPFSCLCQATAILSFSTEGGCYKKEFALLHFHKELFVLGKLI